MFQISTKQKPTSTHHKAKMMHTKKSKVYKPKRGGNIAAHRCSKSLQNKKPPFYNLKNQHSRNQHSTNHKAKILQKPKSQHSINKKNQDSINKKNQNEARDSPAHRYEVATISRLLKIIGLFCKRSL